MGFEIRAHIKQSEITKLYEGMKLKMLRVVLMTLVIAREESVNQPGTVTQFIWPLPAPLSTIPMQTQFLTVDGKMKNYNEHYFCFKGNFFFFLFMYYSTLFHLPPLRTQHCWDFDIGSLKLQPLG